MGTDFRVRVGLKSWTLSPICYFHSASILVASGVDILKHIYLYSHNIYE
jgi:hypothetical protein